MNKKTALFILLVSVFTHTFAIKAQEKAFVAPGTISSSSATLLWDKPEDYASIVRYHIILNGKSIATSTKCNYRLVNLLPAKTYLGVIKAEYKDGKQVAIGNGIKFATRQAGKILNITAYGAKGDSLTLNTKSIQTAIDACPKGGTVYIPKGVFKTGALFLKSYMTLEIAKGGVLKGSGDVNDYMPYIRNRFEGWEMDTYASLLNAGKMDNKGGYSVEQLSIKGEGTISGGSGKLGKEMIDKGGMRSRGRLILLMNCKDVEIQGLNIQDSPSWTIHYIYSKNITCHDLKISSTARNGDGLDPDSSEDSYIFNCSFSTGDDCIAIKSGKNPEGYQIGKPTKNVRITNCDFSRGHGISIGSEMSGGVSDVLVQDCTAGKLLHGMQIKGTKDRGGYVKNVTVADCQLLKITIFSSINYNNDGAAAPVIPTFENFVFRNIDLKKASVTEPVIIVNGFEQLPDHLRNLTFSNILVPDKAKVQLNDIQKAVFENVVTAKGEKPTYLISQSEGIVY